MSRRPVAHPVERLAKAQNRMAPGGLLWSESPIPRRFSPRVPMAGEDPPGLPEVTLRPVTIHSGTIIGGAGNSTLRDLSDTTYTQSQWVASPPATVGALIATFEAATITFTPFIVELTIRARSLSATPGYMAFEVAKDIVPGGTYTPFYGSNDWVDNSETFKTTGAWADHMGFWNLTELTAADVAAGGIQIIVAPAPLPSSWLMDVADVWLVLHPSGYDPWSKDVS